jgi:Protein of unknown function (DUF3298)
MVISNALASLAGAAIVAGVLGCGTASATPAAEQGCTDLGGTVAADQTCHVHSETSSYTMDIGYPLDYPDPKAVSEFIASDRQEFLDWIPKFGGDGRNRPYLHNASAKTYRSARPPTQSLVLGIDDDTGAAHQGHPGTSYKTFAYDLTKQAPITFDTLFKPGSKPLDVLAPIVRRELHAPTLELLPLDFQNFALTDDAVIFFFGEGQVIPGENNGPHQISVPRSELAPLMA